MTVPRRTGGLGRGLGALIPTGPAPTDPQAAAGSTDGGSAPVAGARFAEVPLDRITPNPLQPRSHFDEDALAELVVSIREVGLLQPVVVRQLADDDGGERYELVMGERRWRASRQAGLDAIPAIVRETADDDMLRDALLENLHRQQLNPLEEAAAYQQLLHEFGATHEELASRIGRSRPQISNTIRLLNLPAPVQRRVAAGVLSAGHARAILGLPNAQAQEAMAERVVAEGLSVRGVEEAVHLAHDRTDDGAGAAPARRSKRPVPARLVELGDRLSDRLETRVKLDLGKSRGKMTIEFATLEDLERIVSVMESGPEPNGSPPEQQQPVQQDDGQGQPDGQPDDGHHQPERHHEGGHDQQPEEHHEGQHEEHQHHDGQHEGQHDQHHDGQHDEHHDGHHDQHHDQHHDGQHEEHQHSG